LELSSTLDFFFFFCSLLFSPTSFPFFPKKKEKKKKKSSELIQEAEEEKRRKEKNRSFLFSHLSSLPSGLPQLVPVGRGQPQLPLRRGPFAAHRELVPLRGPGLPGQLPTQLL
jgi:hypothetical protein